MDVPPSDGVEWEKAKIKIKFDSWKIRFLSSFVEISTNIKSARSSAEWKFQFN